MYKLKRRESFRRTILSIIGPLFLLTSLSVLLFTYRLGSLRIDKGQTPGLRDIGTYFNGGLSIIAGENPYENFYFRIGPAGGLLFGVIAKLTPDFLAASFIMAVSAIGFIYFIGFFAGFKSLVSFPWIFMGVVIFISSQRENLVNIQITGILALSAALGFKFLEIRRPLFKTFGLVLIAISIETKPHLLALFVVTLLIYKKEFNCLARVIMTIIIFHAIISIHLQEFVTLLWIRRILSLNRSAEKGELPERIAFETPFEIIGVSPRIAVSIMNLVFVLMVTLLLVLSQRTGTNYLGLLIPSFGIFFHYYDLALAFGLMLTMLYARKEYLTLFLILGLYLIPQNFNSFSNFLLLLMLLAVLAIAIFGRNFLIACLHVGIGIASWLCYVAIVIVIDSHIEIHEFSMSIGILVSLLVGLLMTRTRWSDFGKKVAY